MLMAALNRGIPDAQVLHGAPPPGRDPFVVWGQAWLAVDIIPPAARTQRPFWHIDNGYWQPGRGTNRGNYRMTYRSLSPILLSDVSGLNKKPPAMRQWRTDGRHILIAMPGAWFGRPLGIDIGGWILDIEKRVREQTDRPIVVRQKGSHVLLGEQLRDCWAVVTHSSSVAVDAVLLGVPVFVASTSPAAPVGRLDLDIEDPVTPDREHWALSLACQQFTVDEMYSGFAHRWMQRIAAQVDGARHEDRTHAAAPVIGQGRQVQVSP